MPTRLVPVQRPNGKLYRPRKPPRAMLVEDPWLEEAWVYVLGTHDEQRAYELAMRVEAVGPYPERATWVREAIRGGERWMQEDEARGVPCLIFRIVG